MYATVEFVGNSYTMTTDIWVGPKSDFDDRQQLHDMAVEWAMKKIQRDYGWHIHDTYGYTKVTIPNDEEKA